MLSAEIFEVWSDHHSLQYLESTDTVSVKSIKMRNILHFLHFFSFTVKYHAGTSAEIKFPDHLSRYFSFNAENMTVEGDTEIGDESLIITKSINVIQELPDKYLRFFDTEALKSAQKGCGRYNYYAKLAEKPRSGFKLVNGIIYRVNKSNSNLRIFVPDPIALELINYAHVTYFHPGVSK